MRWVYRAFKLVVTLTILAVIALALVPGKKLADVAVARIEAVSGRKVVLEGDVTTKIFPRLSIQTGPITVSNAAWSEEGPMIAAEGLKFGVEVMPLLRGDFVFRDVTVLTPRVRLEVHKDGRKNWEFTPDTPQTDTLPNDGNRRITVDLAQIDAGKFHFVDRQTGARAQLDKVDLKAQFPDIQGQIDLRASGLYQNALFEVDAIVDRPLDFLSEQISTVQAHGALDGFKFDFDGKLGLKGPVLDGSLSAHLKGAEALARKLGLSDYPLVEDASFAGNVTRTQNGAVFVREGSVEVAHHVVSGDLDLTMGKDRPLVKGVLRTQDIDLTPFMRTSVPSEPPASQGWSSDKLDVSGLFLVDAEIALEAASLDTGKHKFGESRVLMTLENGRAVFDFRKLQAYGGNVTGPFIVNGRGGVSVGGDLKVVGARTGPLFDAMIGFDQLQSKADMSLKFLGVGNNVASIMRSLSGSGTLDVRGGVLTGIDIDEIVQNLDLSHRGAGSETVFKDIAASFTIEKGVLSNNDLRIRTKTLKARGKGTVDLSAKTLAYRLVPVTLKKAGELGGVKVPLLIAGPWSNPKYRLDLEALVDQELGDEKAELKAKVDAARETAKSDVAKKLGISRQDGEILEDAARRAIEEVAAKELGKLLGSN